MRLVKSFVKIPSFTLPVRSCDVETVEEEAAVTVL